MTLAKRIRTWLIAGSVLLQSGVALAANAATVATGDVIAGQPSPWGSAHFVLAAYTAILVGLVLYVLRLSSMARGIRRDMEALRQTVAEREER